MGWPCMRKLTKNEQRIVDYLADRAGLWVSPTQIGAEVGGMVGEGSVKPHLRHSSWASPICLRLVRFGLLQRNYEGHYRVRPRWITRKR